MSVSNSNVAWLCFGPKTIQKYPEHFDRKLCSDTINEYLIFFIVFQSIIRRHGSIEPTSMVYVANQLDSILKAQVKKAKNEVERITQSTGTGEEEILEIIKAYDSLCKQIRALDLPLNVNSLQGLSPVFRGAEVCMFIYNDKNTKTQITAVAHNKNMKRC